MGGVVSRRRKPPPATPQPVDAAAADAAAPVGGGAADEEDAAQPDVESPVVEEDPAAILQQRAEARRQRALALQRKPIPDPTTPVRIRQTLADFLDKDFDSPQALQAAVDEYASEVALLEREGQVVSRLLTAGAAGSDASVNEIRGAIDAFLGSPSRNFGELLDETARKLVEADVELPGPALPRAHGDVNPRIDSGVPPFPGQMPRTAASDAAYLRSISTEAEILEAERRLAEQVAEMKHQRQQAQLQHQYIQKLMAMKREEEEVESVLTSAKVIREQKDLLRKWQAEQENLRVLQEEEHAVQQLLQKANEELMPMLVSHRTLKQGLDKVLVDEQEHEKVIEELAWLESEEQQAAEGTREPLTQEQSFRLDFLMFKKQTWEENRQVRQNRIETEKAMFEEVDWAVTKQRQHVSMIKSDLHDAQERVALAEASCQKLCELSDQLRGNFARLPTTRHPTAYDQNPDELADAHDAHVGQGAAAALTEEEDSVQLVYVAGCDLTHGIQKDSLEDGFATEYYYVGEEMDEQGPNLDALKPDAATTSQHIELEAPRVWPEQFPEECVAARWAGFIAVDSAGQYTFSTESNDGSRLWIAGSLVVDNWGLHGMRRKEGVIALAAGLHTFRADFFVSSGSPGMIVRMLRPDAQRADGGGKEELVEGYHVKGWEAVGAFQSVQLGPPIPVEEDVDAELAAVESPPREEEQLEQTSQRSATEVEAGGREWGGGAHKSPKSPKSPALSRGGSWSGSMRQPSLSLFGRRDSASPQTKSPSKSFSFFRSSSNVEDGEVEGRPGTKSVRWNEGGIESPAPSAHAPGADFFANGEEGDEDATGSRPNTHGAKSVRWDHEDVQEEADEAGMHHERLVLRTAGTEASRPGSRVCVCVSVCLYLCVCACVPVCLRVCECV